MDCNSIIYDAVHQLDKDEEKCLYPNEQFEDEIIGLVIIKIDEYIRLIRPTVTAYISFDGVAPFAKMDQQRTRRYKSAFIAKINSLQNEKRIGWNTSAITPGTPFMDKLSHRISEAFNLHEKDYNVSKIIVSTSLESGEGEHKLFEHCRTHDILDDNIAVYGLDADLIMLSLFHLKYCKNIYVFREAPEFLKSSIPVDVRSDNAEPYFLDILELSTCILKEMSCKFNDSMRINDYVFLCFFLGNDFLPHFPAMNIRTHGIQILLDVYRLCIGNRTDRHIISSDGNIDWRNVEIFITELAKREHELLKGEHYIRNKFEHRRHRETSSLEKEEILNNIPIIYRAEEKYICPEERGWENRYYKALFNVRTKEDVKAICLEYKKGLDWVYNYYTVGCKNWRWRYTYDYGPLFTNLVNVMRDELIDEVADVNALIPYKSSTQLAYVLPKDVSNENRFEYKFSYCRYYWEGHPILKNIDVEELEIGII
jgi:5'-3' exonuclease